MAFFIILFNIYAAPVAAIAFFAVSLIMFIIGKLKNKKIPDSITHDKMLVRKTCLIISSIILAIFVAIFVTIIILLSTDISFM